MNILDYNNALSQGTSTGQKYLTQQGVSYPTGSVIGPSSPGYVQGTANTVPASSGPSPSGSGPAPDSRLTELQKMQQSGGLNPGQQSEYQTLMAQANQYQQPAPVQAPIDYNAIFDPLMQNLAENNPIIQSAYDQNVGNINASRQTRLDETQSNIAGQSAQLNQAKGTQDVASQNAQDEARRQYAEIAQGLQSRYGGTTGTGAFASELAGRQTLQNLANTRQQHSQAILQLDTKLQQVQEIGRLAVQDIEDKTKSALDQAKQQLDSQLQSVRDKQGELLSQKATMAAQAIRDYQTQVQNINSQNSQFKQSLFMQQTAAQNQLNAIQEQIKAQAQYYGLQGKNAVDNLPASEYSFGYQQTPAGNTQISIPAQGTMGAGDLLKKQQVAGAGSGAGTISNNDPLAYLKNIFGY